MTAKPLQDKTIVVTGSSGLLGRQHALAIAEAGGIPALLDLSAENLLQQAEEIQVACGVTPICLEADVTNKDSLQHSLNAIRTASGQVDGLVNNAANNPKMEDKNEEGWLRFENLPLEIWENDLSVGLTGAFLCSQIFGAEMAQAGSGVIVNVASDLSLISPDQRIYREAGLPSDQQPVKSVTYSAIKTGLLGLTRYLATYWAEQGVRVNAISPGSVENSQPKEFVQNLEQLIPIGRMARPDEYRGALVFLLSDASSYMTGSNLVMDGGRTIW